MKPSYGCVLNSHDIEDLFGLHRNSLPNLEFEKVTHDAKFVTGGCLFIYPKKDVDKVISSIESAALTILLNAGESSVSRMPFEYRGKVFLAQEQGDKTARQYISKLYSYIREESSSNFIGITGSVGKSTVRSMLTHGLSGLGETVSNRGNFNGVGGVLETLGRVAKGTSYSVVEIASSRPGDLIKKSSTYMPNIALVTSIGESHMENYSGPSELAEEKFSIFHCVPEGGFCITDRATFDKYKNIVIEAVGKNKELVIVGGAEDPIRIEELSIGEGFVEFHAVVYEEMWRLRLKTLAPHDAKNALFTLAVAYVLQLDLGDFIKRLESLPSSPKRLECFEVKTSDGVVFKVIDDSFNSSPTAVKGALEAVSNIAVANRMFFVFGDMLELGDNSILEHRKVGEEIKNSGFSGVITVGELSKSLFFLSDRNFYVKNVGDVFSALPEVLSCVESGDLFVFKGSHGTNVHKLMGLMKSSPLVASVKKL